MHEMTDVNKTDHKKERSKDSGKILNSTHPRKVVLAGPGTGKSYLFKEAIKNKKAQGGQSFLAITFVGKLSDELADDLAGLAVTTTLHGFARRFALDNCPDDWEYYPRMADVIREDLTIKGIANRNVGDPEYEERTRFYKAFGEDDVVHYATQICQMDENKIPEYDLILVDEFQDFNDSEAEFVDVLAKKNEILIVGDDDQALYAFKGAHSTFIRDKFKAPDNDFESHTLRYCSRCTEVIIKSFHSIVKHYRDKGKLGDRIEKEYKFFPPEKEDDSRLNPKIILLEDVGRWEIPKRIKNELRDILKEQKIKSILVLGEAQTCMPLLISTARKLKEFGFSDVRHRDQHNKSFEFNKGIVFGYKILSEDSNDILGWRLTIDGLSDIEKKKEIILNYYGDSVGFVDAIPDDFKETARRNSRTLQRILCNSPSDRNSIGQSSLDSLADEIVEVEKKKREVFIGQLIDENYFQVRPLENLSITVCSILGAKGLNTDVVFLIGFDQGKFPANEDVEDSEIYQLLVALTRARKRVYLISTMGSRVSQFIDCIDKDCIEKA